MITWRLKTIRRQGMGRMIMATNTTGVGTAAPFYLDNLEALREKLARAEGRDGTRMGQVWNTRCVGGRRRRRRRFPVHPFRGPDHPRPG